MTNIEQIDAFLQHTKNLEVSLSNIVVIPVVQTLKWMLFDTEHNYILKIFDTRQDAKNFLDEVNERELSVMEEQGYFDE